MGRRGRRARWEAGTAGQRSRAGRYTGGGSCRSIGLSRMGRSLPCTPLPPGAGSRSRTSCHHTRRRGRRDRSRLRGARGTSLRSGYRYPVGSRRIRSPGNRRRCCRFDRRASPRRRRGAGTAVRQPGGRPSSCRLAGASRRERRPSRRERRSGGTAHGAARRSSRTGYRRPPVRTAVEQGPLDRCRRRLYPRRRSRAGKEGKRRQPEAHGPGSARCPPLPAAQWRTGVLVPRDPLSVNHGSHPPEVTR